MGLFGSRTQEASSVDSRIEGRFVQAPEERHYASDLNKAALKEQATVLELLAPDEEVVSVLLGEGRGAAGVVLYGSLIVVTDRRLIVCRGRKVRNELLRDSIKQVSTGVTRDYQQQLSMVGTRSDGSYETVVLEFKDLPRMYAFAGALGINL